MRMRRGFSCGPEPGEQLKISCYFFVVAILCTFSNKQEK